MQLTHTEAVEQELRRSDVKLATSNFAQWHAPARNWAPVQTKLKQARWERALPVLFFLAGTVLFWWLFVRLSLFERLFLRLAEFLFFGLLALIIVRTWRRRPNPAVLHLFDIPRAENQFPVRISLLGSGTSLGSDEGVISFVDGWLHYQGLKTSFSLKPNSVEHDSTPFTRHGLQGLFISKGQAQQFETHTLTYSLESFVCSLRIVPFDRVQGIEIPLRDRFNAEIRAWKEGKIPLDGESLMPPALPIRPPRSPVQAFASIAAVLGGALVFGIFGFERVLDATGLHVVSLVMGLVALAALTSGFIAGCFLAPKDADRFASYLEAAARLDPRSGAAAE